MFLLLFGARIAFAEAPTRYEIEQYIRSVAIENNVPPSWAASIAWKESQFNQEAIGNAGEIGLWQFKPFTWNLFTKKYLNKTDNLFANIKNWRWQTIVAVRALADNQWFHWYNSALAKEKEKPLDSFTLNSCMAFLWNSKGIKIKGDAKDIKINTTTPAAGFVVKIKYEKAYHAAFVEQVLGDGIFVSETNFIPHQFSSRFIPFSDKRILGYYAP